MKSKKIVISASASQKVAIGKWLKYWDNKGFKVIGNPVQIKSKDFVVAWPKVHVDFYKALAKTDFHFIANEDKDGISGYIGVGVFAELAFVVGLNLSRLKKITVLIYKIPDSKNIFYKDIMLWLGQGWITLLVDYLKNKK